MVITAGFRLELFLVIISIQSPGCLPENTIESWLYKVLPMETRIRLGRCAGISVFSGC